MKFYSYELIFLSLLIFTCLVVDKNLLLYCAFSYIIWHFINAVRLLNWLQQKEAQKTPQSLGLWHAIFQHIQQQKNQLLDVNHRLKNLEHIRQDFVANVSHELRTPLTVIHGYLETLIEELSNPATAAGDHLPVAQIYQQMQQQTLRMERLVKDLLLLSRLESGTPKEDEQEWIALEQLFAAIRDDAEALSAQHQIELNVAKQLKLWGRKAELQSAFSNLVFNAVHYTPPGGTIRVSAYQDSHSIHIEIEDNGIGIGAEHIPRLTERFYRVNASRSRHTGGTGLGLAIVKHVLLRHHAQLHIKSEVNRGSRFRCDFPV